MPLCEQQLSIKAFIFFEYITYHKKIGVVYTCEHGVNIFYGTYDGSDDKTIALTSSVGTSRLPQNCELMEANMK